MRIIFMNFSRVCRSRETKDLATIFPFERVSEESRGHKRVEGAGTSAEEAHTAFEWYFGRGGKLLGRGAIYDAKKIISRDSPCRECSSRDSRAHFFPAKWVGLLKISFRFVRMWKRGLFSIVMR